MSRLSEKYVAGFLDADGCIFLQPRGENQKPCLHLNFSQKTTKDEVLKRIQEEFGGHLKVNTIKGVNYSLLSLTASTAKKALNRIAKYLVVKRHFAYFSLETAEKITGDMAEFKATAKHQRAQMSYPLPNFPTRKWLAGYFDGDGCLSVIQIEKFQGSARVVSHIAAANADTEGIMILHKAFGGAVHDMRNGGCKQWVLSLSPSKALEFLSYFGKHSIVKRDQILFVLGCAKMKHFRDGENIKAILRQLKAQEQRLSESGVAQLLQNVRDLPLKKRNDYHLFERRDGRIIGKRAA